MKTVRFVLIFICSGLLCIPISLGINSISHEAIPIYLTSTLLSITYLMYNSAEYITGE